MSRSLARSLRPAVLIVSGVPAELGVMAVPRAALPPSVGATELTTCTTQTAAACGSAMARERTRQKTKTRRRYDECVLCVIGRARGTFSSATSARQEKAQGE